MADEQAVPVEPELPQAALTKMQQKAKEKAAESIRTAEIVVDLRRATTEIVDDNVVMKTGVLALKLLIDRILSDILLGKVTFKTGEGAATAMVAAIKLRTELAKQVSGDGSNLDGEDIQAELASIAEAIDRIVPISHAKGLGNQRKRKA